MQPYEHLGEKTSKPLSQMRCLSECPNSKKKFKKNTSYAPEQPLSIKNVIVLIVNRFPSKTKSKS